MDSMEYLEPLCKVYTAVYGFRALVKQTVYTKVTLPPWHNSLDFKKNQYHKNIISAKVSLQVGEPILILGYPPGTRVSFLFISASILLKTEI